MRLIRYKEFIKESLDFNDDKLPEKPEEYFTSIYDYAKQTTFAYFLCINQYNGNKTFNILKEHQLRSIIQETKVVGYRILISMEDIIDMKDVEKDAKHIMDNIKIDYPTMEFYYSIQYRNEEYDEHPYIIIIMFNDEFDGCNEYLEPQKNYKYISNINESIAGEDKENEEMISGIIDMLRQVKNKVNRKQMALQQLKNFKEEKIEIDEQKFLNKCGISI